MFNNHKHLIISIVLLLFLVVPFVLRSSFVKIELFPAIIMPSGSKKVNLQADYLEFKNINLYGIDSVGQEKKLKHTQFLEPVPVWYLTSLVRNGFGIDPGMKKEPKMFSSFAEITSEDREEGKEFLRRKLREQHCIDSLLIVRDEVAFFNMETKVVDSIVVENTAKYELR